MTIIDLIIAAIVLVVVLYIVSIVMSMIPLPAQIKELAWLIIGLLVLLIVLGWFGIGGDILHKQVTSR